CLIIYTMDQNMSPVHPVIRLTSNILGSTELNNWSIQSQILPSIFLAGFYSADGSHPNYPNIKLSKNYKSIIDFVKRYFFALYALDCNISIFIKWITFCIDNFDPNYKKGVYNLFSVSLNRSIYEYIFKDKNMKYVHALEEAISKHYPELSDKILNNLHNLWFMYLIAEKNLNINLVKESFDAISTPGGIPHNFIHSNMEISIKNLKMSKEHLCRDEVSSTKFNALMHIYSSNTTTKCYYYA
ncbi:hypothetical protein NEAUS03_2310, partial [Nematocida ausubeli]